MKEEMLMTHEFTPVLNADRAFSGNPLPKHVLRDSANGTDHVLVESLAYEYGIIHLNTAITEEVSQDFIRLLQVSAIQKKDLSLFINSPGGSVSAGLAMLDAMKAYPYHISICCTGLAASMGAVLLAGGRKGHRYIMPHSKVMIHEPLIAGGVGGSATSIQRTAESILETKKVLNGLLAEFTGRTPEEIDRNTAFDNFFNAEEAIAFGLCDRIAAGCELFLTADERR